MSRGALQVRHVGVAADGAGGAAGRVEQHGVERRRRAPAAASAATDVRRQGAAGPGFRAAGRAAAASRSTAVTVRTRGGELRGLAAGRGAEIGDALAGAAASRRRRQRGGGVLHPETSLVEPGKFGHARAWREAPGAGGQRFPARRRVGAGAQGEVERRLHAGAPRRWRAHRCPRTPRARRACRAAGRRGLPAPLPASAATRRSTALTSGQNGARPAGARQRDGGGDGGVRRACRAAAARRRQCAARGVPGSGGAFFRNGSSAASSEPSRRSTAAASRCAAARSRGSSGGSASSATSSVRRRSRTAVSSARAAWRVGSVIAAACRLRGGPPSVIGRSHK